MWIIIKIHHKEHLIVADGIFFQTVLYEGILAKMWLGILNYL